MHERRAGRMGKAPMIKVTVISDLHGYIPDDLEEGDVLIVAGDLTGRDQEHEYFDVFHWIDRQPFKEKILVAGNHDMRMEMENYDGPAHGEFHYLCDSGVELFGFKFWGSPHSLLFDCINPKCVAYCGTEKELDAFYSKIPDDTDVIISHGPMKHILDLCPNGAVGSWALRKAVDRVKPILLITAHTHEQGGHKVIYKHNGPNTICVNGSYVNEFYDPVNKPVKVLLGKR